MRKHPLRKRYLRELQHEFGKYAVILILMVATIGFVSGFLVADGSMLAAYHEGFTKYNIEDGHFSVSEKLSAYQRRRIDAKGVKVTEQFYKTLPVDNGSKIRVFALRRQVNTLCLMEGHLPKASDEIAIDRMYADNNGIKVGDRIQAGSQSLRVCAFIALPDYSCLFERNSDSMFDAVKFGVGVMGEESFQALSQRPTFSYVWKYDEPTTDEMQEKERAEALSEEILQVTDLQDFVPRYRNQAICFTGEDMGSDRTMVIVLLYIVMAIMAFVFGLTTADTIAKEAAVIGTLRAMGYTKAELIRHYLVMPMIVTVIGAGLGNLAGYTVMKDVCAGMYYGSYSLPTYETLWNGEAFWMTTLIPLLLMALINILVLGRKLHFTPLQFLRREIGTAKAYRARNLSPALPIMLRFRIRILLQNGGNYILMFIGILFANLLLMFGLVMHPVLTSFQTSIQEHLLSKYQYFLAVPNVSLEGTRVLDSLVELMQYRVSITTDNPDAEKFSAWQLQALDSSYHDEQVTFYGIEPNSRYIDLKLSDKDVVISSAYADKLKLGIGDRIRLKEKYENKYYEFEVSGIYPYEAALSVFMTRQALNRTFSLENDYFGGYFSDSEITDISGSYIENVIDMEALTKLSRQLDVSMGEMMYMIEGFAILIFMVLIYLLSKVIIEKNVFSVSMVKILGYSDREIRMLYLHATTAVVFFCILASLPLTALCLKFLWEMMISAKMSGWLPFSLPLRVPLEMVIIGVISYMAVALYEMRKLNRIPMTMALKNAE